MIQELQTRYGRMFIPDTDAGQYEWLINTGASPEHQYIGLVCDLLDERPRGAAIDAGANFGCWTLPLATHADKVFAFEPQRCCFELLARSVRTNTLSNVVIVNKALGSCSGWVGIQNLDINRDANFGGVSLKHTAEDQPGTTQIQVRKTTLDTYFSGERTSYHVSFIKADVEGSEIDVLVGAQQTIARCRPILFVEAVNDYTDIDALGAYILSLGYGIDCQGPNFLCIPT